MAGGSIKKLETKIAKALNKYPYFKDMLRWTRHAIFKPKFNFKTFNNVSIAAVVSEQKEQSFYGYYTNLDSNEKNQFLYHTVTTNERIPNTVNMPATINLYDLKQKKRVKLCKTKAWNWQQGSMLQWYDLTKEEAIFNDFDESKNTYLSKIYSVPQKKVIRTIEKPIYTVARNNSFGLSLSFERLARFRPEYGYFAHTKEQLLTENKDGVWFVDIEQGKTNLLFSLSDLRQLDGGITSDDQWVNHLQISPDANRFLFLNRWNVDEFSFKSRLVLYEFNNKTLKTVMESSNISHYDWYDNERIIIWCEVDGKNSYKLLNVQDTSYEEFGLRNLHSDGHPSCSQDRDIIVTDTYPDKSRLSSLMLYNMKQDNTTLLGKFYQPLKFNDVIRCDLHPRWSKTNKYVSFDSAHSGKREMYIADLKNLRNHE